MGQWEQKNYLSSFEQSITNTYHNCLLSSHDSYWYHTLFAGKMAYHCALRITVEKYSMLRMMPSSIWECTSLGSAIHRHYSAQCIGIIRLTGDWYFLILIKYFEHWNLYPVASLISKEVSSAKNHHIHICRQLLFNIFVVLFPQCYILRNSLLAEPNHNN